VAQKGMNFLFMNDLDAAQTQFAAALKANPENVTALWGMAALYNQFNFKTRWTSVTKSKRAGNPNSRFTLGCVRSATRNPAKTQLDVSMFLPH